MRSPQLGDDFDGDDHGLKKQDLMLIHGILYVFFFGLFMEFDGIFYDI